jgi:NADH dehydrogenase
MRNLVLLGGGYGNMRIIHRLLPNQLMMRMITLIDKNPYHCLKTEYYALAAGTISDHHIRVSFPDHPKLKIEYGTISSVDLEGKKVLFHDREPISYDDAVIGLGCEDKYHNVPGAPEHTYSN